jgi:predicted phosphoribosyltransferase
MSGFRDRQDAGRQLAQRLSPFANRDDVIVLALPRGGVPVAYEVATTLDLPLDVLTVRKIGAPGHEEFALGAIAGDGTMVLDEESIARFSLDRNAIRQTIAREQLELRRREQRYRDDWPYPDVRGKTVILVDDGFATGATMRVALQSVLSHAPVAVIAAAPVAAREVCDGFERQGVRCVCVQTPEPFLGVGAWYDDFSQTSDEEVIALLQKAAAGTPQPHSVPA